MPKNHVRFKLKCNFNAINELMSNYGFFFVLKRVEIKIDYISRVFHYLFLKRMFFCFFRLITPEYQDLIVIQMFKFHLNTRNDIK